jgi:lactate dehydrogenase-like 2-hydroxyacid dehydrogenase
VGKRRAFLALARSVASWGKSCVDCVALDVYEEEEGIFLEDLSGEVLHDDELARLLTFPNVLVTAHQAFLTHEALRIARVTVENVRRFIGKQAFLEGTILQLSCGTTITEPFEPA